MPTGGQKKTWDSSSFRRELKTFWPKSHPVMFPHLQTDHWSKMKTMAPVYLTYLPAALLKETGGSVPNEAKLLPPLTEARDPVPSMVRTDNKQKAYVSPQNMPQYKNVFNDRARRGFCYWLVEKKGSTCKGCLGAYKTFLGLPKL